LLKFWRNAGVGDPLFSGHFNITEDEGSLFDLVITNPDNGFNLHPYQQYYSPNSKQSLFSNNKRKVSPLDSSNTKTPRSPFRALMLGFHNTKTKSDKKKIKRQIEEVTFGSDKFIDNDQPPSKRFSKEVVNKYMSLIKPLYIKVSRRSNDKVRLSEDSVFKHLGKCRSSSSSSAGKFTPSPAARSYDSVLQQDGIQSAILHCKKSYSSPSRECNVLSRSGSAPSQGTRVCIDEGKRCSI
ncbi:hypothetical protein M8C21_021814, partial [Ambrosia artemisiifolia]